MRDTFGLNMKCWCREHEAKVRDALEGRGVPPSPDLLEEHRRMILWLQHERLVHLIVTVMVVFVELFVLDLVLLHPQLGVLPAVVLLALAMLLGFYFYHYFFLENTVQRWYSLAQRLEERARG